MNNIKTKKVMLKEYLMNAFELDWHQASMTSENICKILDLDETSAVKEFFTSSVSTLNYLFLRAICDKECYSECILSELEIYTAQLSELIKENKLPKFIKDAIMFEMEEGTYDFASFENNFTEFAMNLDGDDKDFEIVKNFYAGLIDEILNERNEKEK